MPTTITLTDYFSNGGANVSFTNAFTPAKQWWTSNISSATYEYAPPTSGTDAYAAANGLNQYGSMTPAGGSMQTISYDTRGNLSGDGTWTFGYDPENRMLSASKTAGGTVAATYQYDPLGRRTEKSGTGVTTTFFLHDGDSEIAEYDGSGNLVRRYVPGPVIDQPVAMITCITSACTGSNATKTYFHPDKMGSIVAMSDSTGTRVEGAYRYDSWGNCIATGGVACSAGEPYRFTGQRLDPETGLYYFRARYYSSKLGRFLQTDPIGYKNGLNWYLYVWDDPTDNTDPSGLYICNGPNSSCAEIKTALGDIRESMTHLRPGSSEQNRLGQIINRFGGEGTENGLTVEFGHVPGGDVAGTKITTHNSDGSVQVTMKIDMNLAHHGWSQQSDFKSGLAGTVAHEGRHAHDLFEKGAAATKAESLTRERDAFGDQSNVFKGLAATDHTYQLWDPSWAVNMAESNRAAAIESNAQIATTHWCAQAMAASIQNTGCP